MYFFDEIKSILDETRGDVGDVGWGKMDRM
jgi:hypothetical protein